MATDKKGQNAPEEKQVPEQQDVLANADQIMEASLGGAKGEGDMPEKKQTPDRRDFLADAGQVMEASLDGVKDGGKPAGPVLETESVPDKFKGLPMRDLIGGPLIAAAEAQQNLAAVAWDFYQKIAFDGKNTRILEFTVNRPVEQGGKLQMEAQKIQAPFIGLVPIPSLLIDRIDIDFQMEVKDNNVNKTSSKADASTKISTKWWVTTAEISGSVSTTRENTRTTDQTAKYQVHVTASQQPQTEGLSKLMDIMASCIEPVAV